MSYGLRSVHTQSRCPSVSESLVDPTGGFSSSGVVFPQRRGRQSTGGRESSWGEGRSGRSTSATTPTRAASWPPSKCPLIQTARRRARWRSVLTSVWSTTLKTWLMSQFLHNFKNCIVFNFPVCRRWTLWSVRFSCWRICDTTGLFSTTGVFGTWIRENSPFLLSSCPGCVFQSVYLLFK